MIGHHLGVRVLPGADRVKNVPLRQDADASLLRIDDDGCPDPLGGHQPGRLAQRVRWPDTEDNRGHAVPYVHAGRSPRVELPQLHRRAGPRAGSLLGGPEGRGDACRSEPLGVLVRL